MMEKSKLNPRQMFKADYELHDSRHITVARRNQEIKIYADDVDSGYVDAFADTLEEFLNMNLHAFNLLFKQKLVTRRNEQYEMNKEDYIEEYPTADDYIKAHMDL